MLRSLRLVPVVLAPALRRTCVSAALCRKSSATSPFLASITRHQHTSSDSDAHPPTQQQTQRTAVFPSRMELPTSAPVAGGNARPLSTSSHSGPIETPSRPDLLRLDLDSWIDIPAERLPAQYKRNILVNRRARAGEKRHRALRGQEVSLSLWHRCSVVIIVIIVIIVIVIIACILDSWHARSTASS